MPFVSALGPPSDGVMLDQPSTRLFVNSVPYGSGNLVLATSRLSWVAETGSQFSLEYKGISIHAVSRDTTKFPHQCLYLMVDGDIKEDVARFNKGLIPELDGATPMDAEAADAEESDEEDEDPVTEIRFVPSDEGRLDLMFGVMSDCQALHPDSDDDFSGDEADGFGYGGEEEEEGEEDAVLNGHANGLDNGLDEPLEEESPAPECPTEDEMTPQGLATLRRLEGMLGGGAAAPASDPDAAQAEDVNDEMES